MKHPNNRKSPAHKPRSAALHEQTTPYRVNCSDPGAKFRFIDLFCGIGGFRIAFERAGAECVFSSDWDKFSHETYAKKQKAEGNDLGESENFRKLARNRL
jgi:hypothetical protein